MHATPPSTSGFSAPVIILKTKKEAIRNIQRQCRSDTTPCKICFLAVPPQHSWDAGTWCSQVDPLIRTCRSLIGWRYRSRRETDPCGAGNTWIGFLQLQVFEIPFYHKYNQFKAAFQVQFSLEDTLAWRDTTGSFAEEGYYWWLRHG